MDKFKVMTTRNRGWLPGNLSVTHCSLVYAFSFSVIRFSSCSSLCSASTRFFNSSSNFFSSSSALSLPDQIKIIRIGLLTTFLTKRDGLDPSWLTVNREVLG